MSGQTRWEAPENARMRQLYDRRFRQMHDDGTDLDGEGRFVDALLDRGARVLDAGCGTGRLAAYLHGCGHRALGVDKDETLIATARELQGEHVSFVAADLLEFDADAVRSALESSDNLTGDPAGRDAEAPLDAVVAAGNVMVFLAPGSEAAVLRRFRELLPPGGLLVTGFATDRDYTVDALDADASAAGFELRNRFATYQLGPFDDDADWAVSVFVAV